MAYDSLQTEFLGIGLASARPAAPHPAPGVFEFYYATDTMTLSLWNGSAWITVGGGGLSPIANLDVLANISGSSANPSGTTVSALLDAVFGTTQGAVLYRGASAWAALGPGTVGQVLESGGAGADPSWGTVGGGGITGTGGLLVGGAPTSPSASAFAWKGNVVVPIQNFIINNVQIFLIPSGSSTFQAAIIEYSGTTISSVLALSNSVISTVEGVYNFDFSSTPTLSAGGNYAVVVGITSGVGTTPLPIDAPVSYTRWPAANCKYLTGAGCALRVAQVTLASGQTVDLASAEPYPMTFGYTL